MVAAKQTDRRYFGFELLDRYYEQAVERVIAEVK
jgi:DNA modification methylase